MCFLHRCTECTEDPWDPCSKSSYTQWHFLRRGNQVATAAFLIPTHIHTWTTYKTPSQFLQTVYGVDVIYLQQKQVRLSQEIGERKQFVLWRACSCGSIQVHRSDWNTLFVIRYPLEMCPEEPHLFTTITPLPHQPYNWSSSKTFSLEDSKFHLASV